MTIGRFREEAGIGLIEVVVAMTLLAVALAVFGTGLGVARNAARTSQDMGDVNDELRASLTLLDRQTRSAYWVRTASYPCDGFGNCAGVKVLTQNQAGQLRCWVWVLDSAQRRLLSYMSPVGGWTAPNSASSWHVAASNLTNPSSIQAEDETSALVGSSLSRASYYRTVAASLTFVQADLAKVVVELKASARNVWSGAALSGACP